MKLGQKSVKNLIGFLGYLKTPNLILRLTDLYEKSIAMAAFPQNASDGLISGWVTVLILVVLQKNWWGNLSTNI